MPLVALTDAELGAVTGPDAPDGRLVPLTQLDGLPRGERAAALRTGWRSLHDRGLLDRRGEPTELLAALLAIRAQPNMITVAERVAHGVATNRYLYGTVLPETGDAVLEEDVDAEGAHRFTLHTQASAGERLTAYVDPDARAGQDGPPRIAQAAQPPERWKDVHAAIAAAEVVTRLFSTRNHPRMAPEEGERPEQETAPAGSRSRRASMVAGLPGVVVIAGFLPTADRLPVADGPVVFAQSLSRESLEILLRAFIHPSW